jgi:hypothetical protein
MCIKRDQKDGGKGKAMYSNIPLSTRPLNEICKYWLLSLRGYINGSLKVTMFAIRCQIQILNRTQLDIAFHSRLFCLLPRPRSFHFPYSMFCINCQQVTGSIETLSNSHHHHRESLACGDGNAQVVVLWAC